MGTRHEALYLNGREINWENPPDANHLVMWSKKTMYGKTVKGSLRTVCHLNRLNNLSLNKFGTGIVIIQSCYNTTIAASAGTHDYDACVDWYIPGVSWWDMQRFGRANGHGCWYRYPPLFINHIHGFTLPPREGRSIGDDFKVAGFRVGKYVDGGYSLYGHEITSSQLVDYYEERSGLSGHAPDHSWHPGDIEDTIFNLKQYIHRRQKRR